jgi:hypothetical protein
MKNYGRFLEISGQQNLDHASMSPRWQGHYRDALIIFILLALSYAYFIPTDNNWNLLSRISLTAAIVEHGELSIDEYTRAWEMDKAFYHGHFYSDKAPGLSFLALPAVWLAKKFVGLHVSAAGLTHETLILILYIATQATCGVVTAASGACLFLIALRIFGSYGGAVFAVLAYGLGTPTWGWATNFVGHAISGAWLVLGFFLMLVLLEAGSTWRAMWVGFAAGLFFGIATVVEYTAAPAAIVIVAAFISLLMRQKRIQSTFITIFPIVLGGLLAAIPLLTYNRLVFGSAFALSYSSVEGFEGMQQGFFGITRPRLSPFFQIIFGRYRGILWVEPILMLAPIACIALWRERRFRFILVITVAIVLYYLLLNASYYYWDGGASLGPRHITPMLGFAVLPLAGLWQIASRSARWLMIGLLALSTMISLACVSVGMAPYPAEIKDPLFQVVFPHFFAGELPTVAKRLFGPTGIANLLPLCFAWLMCTVALWWSHTASDRITH